MSGIFFEKAKNYEINGDKIVKVIAYNNGEIEVKGTKNKQNNLENYKKISKTEYVILLTGEIKQYKKETYKKAENIKRAMKELKGILKNNFKGGDNEIFLTLTCEDNITDYDYVHKKAEEFMRILRQLHKGLEYVMIMEQQERGSWHIHALIKDTLNKKLYINNEEICAIWRIGITKTERVKETNFIKVIEYMTKTKTKEKLPAEKKAYYKSRGIKKATTQEMQYKNFCNTKGKNAKRINGIAVHIKSIKNDKIINTHFKEIWKENKHNDKE